MKPSSHKRPREEPDRPTTIGLSGPVTAPSLYDSVSSRPTKQLKFMLQEVDENNATQMDDQPKELSISSEVKPNRTADAAVAGRFNTPSGDPTDRAYMASGDHPSQVHGLLKLPRVIASSLSSDYLVKRDIRALGVTCWEMLRSLNQCDIKESVSLRSAIERLDRSLNISSELNMPLSRLWIGRFRTILLDHSDLFYSDSDGDGPSNGIRFLVPPATRYLIIDPYFDEPLPNDCLQQVNLTSLSLPYSDLYSPPLPIMPESLLRLNLARSLKVPISLDQFPTGLRTLRITSERVLPPFDPIHLPRTLISLELPPRSLLPNLQCISWPPLIRDLVCHLFDQPDQGSVTIRWPTRLNSLKLRLGPNLLNQASVGLPTSLKSLHISGGPIPQSSRGLLDFKTLCHLSHLDLSLVAVCDIKTFQLQLSPNLTSLILMVPGRYGSFDFSSPDLSDRLKRLFTEPRDSNPTLANFTVPISSLTSITTAHERGTYASLTRRPSSSPDFTHLHLSGFRIFDLLKNVTHFPHNLLEIELDSYSLALDLLVLPPQLERLSVICESESQTVIGLKLPTSLKSLKLGGNFSTSLKDWTPPDGLRELIFGWNWNHPIVELRLPPQLLLLEFGFHFKQNLAKLRLPESLVELRIGNSYRSKFDLPIHRLRLPAGLRRLCLPGYWRVRQVRNGLQVRLPSGLRSLVVGSQNAKEHIWRMWDRLPVNCVVTAMPRPECYAYYKPDFSIDR